MPFTAVVREFVEIIQQENGGGLFFRLVKRRFQFVKERAVRSVLSDDDRRQPALLDQAGGEECLSDAGYPRKEQSVRGFSSHSFVFAGIFPAVAQQF